MDSGMSMSEAGAPMLDGAPDDASYTLRAAPPGLAGFGLVINGVVQTPMNCPSDNWEFPLPPGEGQPGPPGEGQQFPNAPPPGIKSAVLVNTSTLAMAYIVQPGWGLGIPYPPGVATGNSHQLAGVLSPGAQLDIASVYLGGIVAIVGSAEPFSSPDAGKYIGDEGTIPWPGGVAGSGGATIMHVAQIDVPLSPPSSCTAVPQCW
jgi:hypothetical protein